MVLLFGFLAPWLRSYALAASSGTKASSLVSAWPPAARGLSPTASELALSVDSTLMNTHGPATTQRGLALLTGTGDGCFRTFVFFMAVVSFPVSRWPTICGGWLNFRVSYHSLISKVLPEETQPRVRQLTGVIRTGYEDVGLQSAQRLNPRKHDIPRARLDLSCPLRVKSPVPLKGDVISGTDPATGDRLLALVEMVRAVSVDPDPVRSTTSFVQAIRDVYGNVGLVTIGTRGAPPGHYRLTRLLHQPGIEGDDLDYPAAQAPLHSGGFLGEVMKADRPTVLETTRVEHDPVLGNQLRPYRVFVVFPVITSGDIAGYVVQFSTDAGAFTPEVIVARFLTVSLLASVTQAKRVALELDERSGVSIDQGRGRRPVISNSTGSSPAPSAWAMYAFTPDVNACRMRRPSGW